METDPVSEMLCLDTSKMIVPEITKESPACEGSSFSASLRILPYFMEQKCSLLCHKPSTCLYPDPN